MKTKLTFYKIFRYVILGCLPIVLIALNSFNSVAQTNIASGTTFLVNAGTTVTSNNRLIINNGGALNIQGTLICDHNLENNNPGYNSVGSGQVVFTGHFHPSILGQNIFSYLTVNTNDQFNLNGVAVGGNTRVNGILTLTHGCLELGNSNLLLGASASVAGSPASANMVIATGTGQFQKMFSTAGSFTFPVGDETNKIFKQYSPVTLQFNSGTFGENNMVGVNLVNAQYPGTSTAYLLRYWNVTQSGISDFACNATFQYPTADIIGGESIIFSYKVDPVLPWIAYNLTDYLNHQLTVHGLSSFGTFTGNVGEYYTVPPIRSLQDQSLDSTGGPANFCADATQKLVIAGNGTYYNVHQGAHVNHIAGQNIVYLPGTKVFPGGYMHGYISVDFCSPYGLPAAAVNTGVDDQTNPINAENSFFKVFPNPTTGKFTLELKGDASSVQGHIDILTILGDRIFSKDILLERTQEFFLSDRPTGMYVIRVTSGVNSRTEKIIKQ